MAATELLGYAVVTIDTGTYQAASGKLPFAFCDKDNKRKRIASFDKVGQTVGNYKLVEYVRKTAPSQWHSPVGDPKASVEGDQLVIDPNWTARPLAEIVAGRQFLIHTEARKRIKSVVPEWQQIHLALARIDLIAAHVQNGSLTADEEARWQKLTARSDQMQAVAGHVTTMEAEIDAINQGPGTDAEKLTAIEAWSSSGWPELT